VDCPGDPGNALPNGPADDPAAVVSPGVLACDAMLALDVVSGREEELPGDTNAGADVEHAEISSAAARARIGGDAPGSRADRRYRNHRGRSTIGSCSGFEVHSSIECAISRGGEALVAENVDRQAVRESSVVRCVDAGQVAID
jgi:hypothetical protein